MVAHGTSIAISFRMKQEQDMSKVKTMLDLSGSVWIAMMLSLLVAGIAGIVMGFMLSWWSQWWIWVSIVLLLVITIWMFQIGQGTLMLLVGYGGFVVIIWLMMFKLF
jgi:membrane protein YdbS with pleckstrin-like domain